MKFVSKKTYYIVGSLFLLIFITRLFLGFSTGDISFVELLAWGTLAYISFIGANVFPGLQGNDERVKYIKQKSLSRSAILIALFVAILVMFSVLGDVVLTTTQLLTIIICFSILCIFTFYSYFVAKY